jgi:single-stranded DNA-specific DHH superfamily exonuclease
MLSEKQISEIREHLEKAQNPIFYYDNDADGFCSYVLLRRFLDRGKGVAVRSFPELDAGYARKAKELNADYVFVLDKPVLSREFMQEMDDMGLPVVWIDHHDVERGDYEKDFGNLWIYNPARNSGDEKSEEPVTYLSYKIANRKEDVWLAVIGCIADHYLPEFASDFKDYYPEYWGQVKEPFDAYYRTEIGRIAMALNFGLKDSISHVVQLQNFMISCRGPEDVFQEISGNYHFRRKYLEVKKKYEYLLEKAKNQIDGNILVFEYAGDLSISADLANELSYLFPDAYIAVIYKKGNISNLSMRGKNVKKVLEAVLSKIEGSGGGHDDAVGGRISTGDLERFREILKQEVGK